MKPSSGRIVHYVPPGRVVLIPEQCQAAIVTAALPGELVLLAVFPPGDLPLVVSEGAAHDEELKAGGTWHWPERVPE